MYSLSNSNPNEYRIRIHRQVVTRVYSFEYIKHFALG